MVLPPVRKTAPLLVSPPVANVPKPESWPVLVRGRPLLSKVPPARLMTPALAARPVEARIFEPAAARRMPGVLLRRGPVRERVPPIASIVPLLVRGLETTPRPWIVPVLVSAPPTRCDVGAPSWIAPELVRGCWRLRLPAGREIVPALVRGAAMVPGPMMRPAAVLTSALGPLTVAPPRSRVALLVREVERTSCRPGARVIWLLLVAPPALAKVKFPAPWVMTPSLTRTEAPEN